MALFLKKEPSIIFDKEKIISEILCEAPLTSWMIFHSHSLDPNLLCIRSVDIQKEIQITENPFSNYRNVIPSVYQIVVGVYVAENSDDVEIKQSSHWRSMVVNSANMLFNKLDMEE